MSAVILIFNQKGDVAKTTTSVNLSMYYAIDGKKVLLMDMDPQINATLSLGIYHNIENSVSKLVNNEVSISDTIIETKEEKEKKIDKTDELTSSPPTNVEEDSLRNLLGCLLIKG